MTTWLHRSPGARTLVLSFREQASGPGRTHLFELENLLVTMEGADLLAVDRYAGSKALLRLRGRLERTLPALAPLGWPGHAPLDRDYDLLVVACQDPSDLLRLGPLEPWRRRCARAICLTGEVWLHELERRRGELSLLSRFDAVFTSCRGSVRALQDAIGKPAAWLAPAVDALLFRPSGPDSRSIDVYSLGRRSQALHEGLLAEAARRRWFYLYSTTTGQQVPDPAAHRARLAGLIQRSRFFVVQIARAGDPALRQQEVGTRYIEGAAGGAVLIGEIPSDVGFGQLLDWPDAVRPLPVGGSIRGALDALEADPERLERARLAGVTGVLRGHDWAHRWGAILDSLGLPAGERLRERVLRLQRTEAELLDPPPRARVVDVVARRQPTPSNGLEV